MKKEEVTLQKLKKLQQDSTKIIEELNEKYKEIKDTVWGSKEDGKELQAVFRW